MSTLPACTPAKVLRALEQAGFILVRQKESHRMYIKTHLSVVIPFHNKDLKKGTLKNIIKQSGLTLEEFLELL